MSRNLWAMQIMMVFMMASGWLMVDGGWLSHGSSSQAPTTAATVVPGARGACSFPGPSSRRESLAIRNIRGS